MAQIARAPQRPVLAMNMLLPHPRRVLRVAVAPRAGELAKQPHLKTLERMVLASLLTMTRVTAPTATRIVESASLLPTTLPVVVGAAEALVALAVVRLAVPVALAVVLPVVLVALGAPTVEVAICLGKRSGRPLQQRRW